jgi:hypothetical protein
MIAAVVTVSGFETSYQVRKPPASEGDQLLEAEGVGLGFDLPQWRVAGAGFATEEDAMNARKERVGSSHPQ